MISDGTDNMVMPVSPMGNMNGGCFGDGFGNGGWWILLLFILLGGNGWNRGFGANQTGSDSMYPWLNQQNQINDGFRDQMLNQNISDIQNGVNGISNQLCNGFAGVNATVNAGFAGVEAGANTRQIANMQQAFAAQTAVTQGMNALGASLQNCCCENRANIADLKYTVATENCADRSALSDGLRDLTANNTYNTQTVLNAINSGFQGIKDELCADRLAAKDAQIADLTRQLSLASLQASQDAQTAAIQSGQRNLANEVEQYVNPTPRPAFIVSNPNCCQPTTCGM